MALLLPFATPFHGRILLRTSPNAKIMIAAGVPTSESPRALLVGAEAVGRQRLYIRTATVEVRTVKLLN